MPISCLISWDPKIHFHLGRLENKNRPFFFDFRNPLPIKIQLLDTEVLVKA
jgi:hypothetical protein